MGFEVLSGRDQILKRPQMWIGSMDPIKEDCFIIREDKVSYETIEYIPGLKKITDEILDNSIDALIKEKDSTGTIKVEVYDDYVIISDDGNGIPVIKKELTAEEEKSLSKSDAKLISNSYIPELAWTRLFAGSNFDDSDDSGHVGSHGVGSKCASIFSTKFIGTTDDGIHKCVVTSVNNLEKSKCKISETSGKRGTIVKFYPDVEKFGLTKIDKIYKDLIYQRLICLSEVFPNITFYFNKQRIRVNEKKFLGLFSANTSLQIFNNGFIGVFSNEFDDFKYFTYVDGLYFKRGGTHIDYITNQLISPIREKLEKTCKNIKPADIKNKLSLVVFMRNFPKLKYDSQTKDTLSNSVAELSEFFKDVDFNKLAKDVLKNEAIINPIVDIFKLKQELKSKQELVRAKRVKLNTDKYMPPIGKLKSYLALCEGDSAQSGISASLGRQGIGYYAMKGLPLNAYSSSMQKIAANTQLKDIINILELDISSKDPIKTISYDNIMITSDNDADGSHITAMLIGWFRRFAPNLFDEGKICKLVTPLIIIVDKKDNISQYFFDVNSFKAWEAKNKDNKNKIIYQKGLGSWERNHLISLFDKYGVDKFILQYKLTPDGDVYIEDWLGDDAEKRKTHLRSFNFDIDRI